MMILDIIVLLIIALFTFLGYKQGLVKTIIKIFAFFIALFVAISFYKLVGNVIINNTGLDEKIERKIISKVLPENYEEKISILPNSMVEAGEQSINSLAVNISHKIIYYTTFLVLFLIIKIALKFFTIFADIITKLPIIKQLDKTGGIVYGLAKGFVIVTAIFAVISLISPIIDVKYINTIEKSYLSKILYKHNLIIGLIK